MQKLVTFRDEDSAAACKTALELHIQAVRERHARLPMDCNLTLIAGYERALEDLLAGTYLVPKPVAVAS